MQVLPSALEWFVFEVERAQEKVRRWICCVECILHIRWWEIEGDVCNVVVWHLHAQSN